MTLSELQAAFTFKVALLVSWAYTHGYKLTYGEAYRTPEQASWDVEHGTGILNSEHGKRLAVDFNLFIGGVYRADAEAYRPLGEQWKSLSEADIPCCWGGDFHRLDGNHFSIRYEGVE